MKIISVWLVLTLLIIALLLSPVLFAQQVNVTGTDLAPTFSPGFSASIVRLRFVSLDPFTVWIDTIKAELTGTAIPADINAVELYQDLNGNDVVDGGEPSVAFQNGVGIDRKIILSGAPLFSVPDFTTLNYLLRYTINLGVNPSRTVGAHMASGDVISNNPLSSIIFGGVTTANRPLPVQLTSFVASASRFTVKLVWSTATEVNNYGFEIEKKPINDSRWYKISFVTGAGTSTAPREYTFFDRSPSAGRYSYRLKQIDNDGTSDYSQSVEVEIGAAPVQLTFSQNYPNPFNPSTTLTFTLPEDGQLSLKVYDMLGREITTLFNGNAKSGYVLHCTFEASRFTSGIYFARLQFGNKELSQKMLLVK